MGWSVVALPIPRQTEAGAGGPGPREGDFWRAARFRLAIGDGQWPGPGRSRSLGSPGVSSAKIGVGRDGVGWDGPGGEGATGRWQSGAPVGGRACQWGEQGGPYVLLAEGAALSWGRSVRCRWVQWASHTTLVGGSGAVRKGRLPPWASSAGAGELKQPSAGRGDGLTEGLGPASMHCRNRDNMKISSPERGIRLGMLRSASKAPRPPARQARRPSPDRAVLRPFRSNARS